MSFVATKDKVGPVEPTGVRTGWLERLEIGTSTFLKTRTALGELGGLSDGQLRDIGLIRNDVDVARRQLRVSDPADELGPIARSRTGNW
jgi:uncharacterized protein YjiS (DUF1127 family)